MRALNEANRLLSWLEVNPEGAGGLAEHMVPLQAAVTKLKAIAPLLERDKLADVLQCDEVGWKLRLEDYQIALRILGRAVRFGFHAGQ